MSLLGQFLATALSPFGVLAALLGFVSFLAGPLLGAAGIRTFSNFSIWLACYILGRPAIAISEHGEPLLKKMQFDSLGVEKITFEDETKEFSDPNAALHQFMGFPFALASEPDGVLFDPRHAFLGQRKHDAQQHSEWALDASTEEWRQFEVAEWMRGVFEAPDGRNVLPDLTHVKRLKWGGERAEYSQRVEQLWEKYLAELEGDSTSSMQFIMIVVALIAPFAACWLIASQGGASAGGSTISGLSGSSLALLASQKRQLGQVVGVAVPLAAIAGIGYLFGPGVAVAMAVLYGFGLAVVPMLAWFVRAIGVGAEGLARKFMQFGLLGYSDPVFEWRPEGYRLADAAELDIGDDVAWYSLCGSRVGFSFEPSERSWGAEVVGADDIDSYRDDTVADGGQFTESNIPATHAPAPDFSRGRIGGFLPKRVRDNTLYLHTGIALERFAGAAQGQKALNRLLWAKENHDGQPISDRGFAYLTVGCGVFSMAAGIGVFFLL